VLDYYRLTADHRLLFGGRVSYYRRCRPRISGSHAALHARSIRI
jgi:hypothetical protein